MTYNNGITIDGIFYDIPLLDLKRTADVLDKYAERTEDGVLHRELIGVYFNYQLTIGTINDVEEYNRLWEKLTEPVASHTVTLPSSTGNYSFQAYITGVSDNAFKIYKDKNHFNGLTCKFTATNPART